MKSTKINENEKEIKRSKQRVKEKFTFGERCSMSQKLLAKKSDFVPIVVELEVGSQLSIKKQQFFVSGQAKISDFLQTLIQNYINTEDLRPINHVSLKLETPRKVLQPSHDSTLRDLYAMYKEDDGFMYFILFEEGAFGNA